MNQARQIVIEDQRQSYPDMTEDEAIQHALNTVSLDEVVVEDEDDESAMAWRMVLRHGR